MCTSNRSFLYSACFKNKDVFVVEQTISGNVLLKHHCLFNVEKVVMFMQVICCVDCLKQILIYLCTLNNNLLYFRASVAFLFSLSYSIPEINRLCGPVF